MQVKGWLMHSGWIEDIFFPKIPHQWWCYFVSDLSLHCSYLSPPLLLVKAYCLPSVCYGRAGKQVCLARLAYYVHTYHNLNCCSIVRSGYEIVRHNSMHLLAYIRYSILHRINHTLLGIYPTHCNTLLVCLLGGTSKIF